ncbi:unnamed protein product [Candidula unifasciata]|uniref:EF-hand domain-containing protein n=1 Tax=Candidula unifasciata TaxID=100452 RepID=A0A8S3YQ44_9EUPU|nr:unnamed protein product [Candidula unifasciata]
MDYHGNQISFKMDAMQEMKLKSNDATEYLLKHRIQDLFNNLTAQLIYTRPDNPKAFLIEALENLQKARVKKVNYPCLFDESNIRSVFGMLDPTGRGFVTLKQYHEAMITLGAREFDLTPHGADMDQINLETFTREALRGLSNSSATFCNV